MAGGKSRAGQLVIKCCDRDYSSRSNAANVVLCEPVIMAAMTEAGAGYDSHY
jgi:hypothetical protein